MIRSAAAFCALMLVPMFGATITSGSIHIPPGLGGSNPYNISVQLYGDGFSILLDPFSGGLWGPATSCSSCLAVATPSVSVSAFVTSNNFRFGLVTIGDNVYQPYFGGNTQYSPPSSFTITGPSRLVDAGPGIYTSTFDFTGNLCGDPRESPGGVPCGIEFPSLTGSGSVTVEIFLLQEHNPPQTVFNYREATYTFYVAEVPEPSTIYSGVLAAAMVLLSARRRRRA